MVLSYPLREDGVRRRDFIAGGSAAAWPLVAGAEQPTMAVIGFDTGQEHGDVVSHRIR